MCCFGQVPICADCKFCLMLHNNGDFVDHAVVHPMMLNLISEFATAVCCGVIPAITPPVDDASSVVRCEVQAEGTGNPGRSNPHKKVSSSSNHRMRRGRGSWADRQPFLNQEGAGIV